MKTNEIFLSDESIANEFIREYEYPFMALPEIQEYIMYLGSILNNDYEEKTEHQISINITHGPARNCSAYIKYPCSFQYQKCQ